MYREPGSVTYASWVGRRIRAARGPLQDVVDRLPRGGGLGPRGVVVVDP